MKRIQEGRMVVTLASEWSGRPGRIQNASPHDDPERSTHGKAGSGLSKRIHDATTRIALGKFGCYQKTSHVWCKVRRRGNYVVGNCLCRGDGVVREGAGRRLDENTTRYSDALASKGLAIRSKDPTSFLAIAGHRIRGRVRANGNRTNHKTTRISPGTRDPYPATYI